MTVKPDVMLKKLMEYHGVNQLELAAIYKWDPSQVSRWINGKATPRGDVLLQINEEYNKVKDEQPPLFKQIDICRSSAKEL